MENRPEIQALHASCGLPLAPGGSRAVLMGAVVALIGRLGGHPGCKSDGPGREVLRRGLPKLTAITEAWRVFLTINTCG